MVSRDRGRRGGEPGLDPLTRRETEVLDAIGRRLTNGELADELHVSVRTVESHVAALRRKLGATSRGELIEAANRRARSSAVVGPDSSFVGREGEVAALAERLAADRLVTLVGPAGVGKSRLARELARGSSREVRLADLVGVAADQVAVAVADAIGVSSAEGADVVGGARLALADRDLLLVVDNADDVVGPVGELVALLVEAAPGLQVVVTSRRRLGPAAEVVHTVEPLGLPDRLDALDVIQALDAIEASPAVRLLVDRARAVRPDFDVGPANAAAVLSLCRRLDGLPLGLELAAARLASTDVVELDAVLADRIDLLGRPGSTDTRHRSLVAAVEGSLAGLADGDLVVLEAVASLPGPATLDELRVVVEAVDPGVDTARAVLDLVDRSLLAARLRPGATTYRMLETIRAVVTERTVPARVDRFRAAHARYHAEGVETAVARSRRAEAWAYDDDISRRTLLGALRWAAEHDPDLGIRLLTGIARRYELDPTVAVLDGLRRTLVDWALPGGWPSEPLAWAAVSLNYLDLDLMERAAAEALDRASTEDERAVGRWAVGFAAGYLGREQEGIDALERAGARFRERGDRVMVGLGLMAEGLIRSDPALAVAALESSLLTCLEAGDRWHANSVRLMLARRAIEAGVRLDEVPIWLDECDDFARGGDSLRHDRAHAVAARAEWAATLPGPNDAGELAGRAAEAFRHNGDLRCLVRALLLQARTEADPERAVVQARRAVGAAVLQGDRRAQATALDAVAALAATTGDAILAARARGCLHRLAGRDQPPADELEGPVRTPLLEGFIQGPSLVAVGHDEPLGST